jgi:5-deoxy-glucuronate isomerase
MLDDGRLVTQEVSHAMSRGADNGRWFWPAGSRTEAGCDLVVDDRIDDWQRTGLVTVTLAPGESLSRDLGSWEAVVVPLCGPVTLSVTLGGTPTGAVETIHLTGRENVFAGPSDIAYAPRGSSLVLTGAGGGPGGGTASCRVALCLALDDTGRARPPLTHLPAAGVPVELRGAGVASRQVRSFGLPGVLEANRIIACEVITPAGNWSSWPPHKHDTERPGVETELEEIYYFETRSTDERGLDPIGYQRVYGTEERPIDVLAEVRSGDVVLVPHGWHGPAVAAPDAELYYLNVMAGPGPERAWLICDDPVHGWVRESWPDLPLDPRLTTDTITPEPTAPHPTPPAQTTTD